MEYREDQPQHSDAEWFAARPERSHRLRPVHSAERGHVATNRETHIIVCQVRPGERQRRGISLSAVRDDLMTRLSSDEPREPVLDEILARLVKRAISGRTVELGAVIQAVVTFFKRKREAARCEEIKRQRRRRR